MQDHRVPGAGVAEPDGDIVAERGAEERPHADVVARARHRERELPAGRERHRLQRCLRWCDCCSELRACLRCEVAAPSADVLDRVTRQGEEAERRPRRHVAGKPDDLRGRTLQILRAVRHRDELVEVLGEDVRSGDRERRLVALALRQRGAIADREQREPEARDQERRRDGSVPGVARERRRCEPKRDRAAPSGATECAQCRREQPCGDDRGGEDDERRNEQQERVGPAAACQLLRADGAARPADEHDADRTERCHVERREREPAELHAGCANRCVEQQSG